MINQFFAEFTEHFKSVKCFGASKGPKLISPVLKTFHLKSTDRIISNQKPNTLIRPDLKSRNSQSPANKVFKKDLISKVSQ